MYTWNEMYIDQNFQRVWYSYKITILCVVYKKKELFL